MNDLDPDDTRREGWLLGAVEHRPQLAMGAAVVAPLCLAVALIPFRTSFATTAAALVFVAVIVACAVAGNRLTGAVASAASAIWFDFFLTEPYGRLAISHRADLETTICLLIVGLVVTELAARSRHHRHAADEASLFVAMLHHLAERTSGPTEGQLVVHDAEDLLVELLSLRSCHFERTLSRRPIARVEADGGIVHAGIRWPAQDLGIPGPTAEIIARWRGQTMGRFVLTPTPGRPVGLERRIVAVALVDLAAASLCDDRLAAEAAGGR